MMYFFIIPEMQRRYEESRVHNGLHLAESREIDGDHDPEDIIVDNGQYLGMLNLYPIYFIGNYEWFDN